MCVRTSRQLALWTGLWALVSLWASAGFADRPIRDAGRPAVSARLEQSLVDDSTVILTVELDLPPGATTNPLAGPSGASGATQIEVSEATDLAPLAEFSATPAPKPVRDPATGERHSKHVGSVRFTRNYRVSGPSPQVSGAIRFIYCHEDSCQRLTEPFTARLEENVKTSPVALLADPPPAAGGGADLLDAPMDIAGPGELLDLKSNLGIDLKLGSDIAEEAGPANVSTRPQVRAELHPLEGSKDCVVLQVILEIPDEHYSYSQNKKINKKPTRITVEETTGLTPTEELFQESPAAEVHFDEAFQQNVEKHEGTVTFSRKYTCADASKIAAMVVKGNVNLLLCKKDKCTPFPQLPFAASYHPTPVSLNGPGGAAESDVLVTKGSASTLLSNLLLAFVGGIILNVMPCVLPVIGIKVVSFVEQSGESRWRVFALNWTYAAGSMLVFLILGTLAAVFALNSGQVFQSDAFKIVFGVIVFAMALSLLGVFELNLPGVATGFGLSDQKEGLVGAFVSGIVATFLATPCIGPFMGPALGWSLSQSVPVIYAIWLTLGLGMTLPYLILGLAPRLVSWLPRPGMWMVRFKQFSGFLLLATVLFLVQPLERGGKATADPADTVPVVVDADSMAPDMMKSKADAIDKPLTGVLIALLGMGIGLWMIGNLYNHASSKGQKWKVRAAALAISVPFMWYGTADHFGLRLLPSHELAWEDWSEERMKSHLAEGRPLFIDFTADWCATCKFNEATALNRSGTKKFLEANNFVAMKADFTEESAEIKKWLTKFMASGVPVYVIYPPGESREPIIFEGVLTQGMVLQKLADALKRGKAPAESRAALSAARTLPNRS